VHGIAERLGLEDPLVHRDRGGNPLDHVFTERAQEFLAQFAGRQLEKPFNIDEVELLLSELSAAGAA